MRTDLPQMLTPGRIAQLLDVPLPRIQHILRTRDIFPAALAGRIRLYDSMALARVRYEVNLQDANRERAACES